jgi:hypothetical protein
MQTGLHPTAVYCSYRVLAKGNESCATNLAPIGSDSLAA